MSEMTYFGVGVLGRLLGDLNFDLLVPVGPVRANHPDGHFHFGTTDLPEKAKKHGSRFNFISCLKNPDTSLFFVV